MVKGAPTDCWLWRGSLATNGYGKFATDSAHRFVMKLTHGSIPEGAFVLHSCDVRHCVNPAHLRFGTQQDNVNDMVSRNRQAKGDTSGSRLYPERLARGIANNKSRLTEAQVLEIRASDLPQRTLAKLYGVSRITINAIRMRKTWTHLPGDYVPKPQGFQKGCNGRRSTAR